jgi:hypothetical protein
MRSSTDDSYLSSNVQRQRLLTTRCIQRLSLQAHAQHYTK